MRRVKSYSRRALRRMLEKAGLDASLDGDLFIRTAGLACIPWYGPLAVVTGARAG
jgi:hypothetical protein